MLRYLRNSLSELAKIPRSASLRFYIGNCFYISNYCSNVKCKEKGVNRSSYIQKLTLKDCDTRGSNRGLWALMCIIRYLGTPNPPKQSRLQILVCGRKQPPHLGFTSSTVYCSPCIPRKPTVFFHRGPSIY